MSAALAPRLQVVPGVAAPLFDLCDDLVSLLDTVEMLDPDSPERARCEAEIEQYVTTTLPHKADRIGAMLRHLEAQAKTAAEQAKRFSERKQRLDRQYERLEGYCIRALELLPAPKEGPRKIEGDTVTLSLRPSEQVKIDDMLKVPAEFKTAAVEMPLPDWERTRESCAWLSDVRPETKVRKLDVKSALKEGREVPGADLIFHNNLKVTI